MSAAGWPSLAFDGSMKLFAREDDVTPFLLLSNIAGRRWGGYAIEGNLGILHRPFERHWSATRDAGTDTVNELTASLHSANIRELNDFGYIDPRQGFETQVYVWCESVVAILNTLPMTHAELSLAHREKRLLAGRPLDHFLLTGKNEKSAAFRQFMEGAPLDHAACRE
jgi:hypothetical protein